MTKQTFEVHLSAVDSLEVLLIAIKNIGDTVIHHSHNCINNKKNSNLKSHFCTSAAAILFPTVGSLGSMLVTRFCRFYAVIACQISTFSVQSMRKSLVTLRFALYGCKNRPFFYIVATNRYKPRNRGYLEQVQKNQMNYLNSRARL